jgi:hypothetical protein
MEAFGFSCRQYMRVHVKELVNDVHRIQIMINKIIKQGEQTRVVMTSAHVQLGFAS